LPGLALNFNPPDLCLLSSWDYRWKLLCPVHNAFFAILVLVMHWGYTGGHHGGSGDGYMRTLYTISSMSPKVFQTKKFLVSVLRKKIIVQINNNI
jgi:hypothetical protein